METFVPQRFPINSKLNSSTDERNYLLQKQQKKQRQVETILRYIDEFTEIDNEKAREILLLPDNKISEVSRLFSFMKEKEYIEVNRRGNRKTFYKRKD
jgi:hypothetical protein